MRIFHFDRVTGVFAGESEAVESPLEPGHFLIPAFATSVAVPEVVANEVAVFDFSMLIWTVVADHRGVYFDTASGAEVLHGELGALPAGLTALLKPDGFFVWDGDSWVVDLVGLRASVAGGLKAACESAIVAGIVCDALGADFHYPTGRDDQINISGLVTESLMPGAGDSFKFWCADMIAGDWERRVHSKVQIQALGLAVSSHVKAAQARYELRLGELAAAGTEAAISAVVW